MTETIAPESGLSFEFTDEQKMFREVMRDVANRDFSKAYCREVEERKESPWDLWEKVTGAGLTAIGVPEAYGGQGGGIIEEMILAEELSRTMAGLLWIWGVTSFAGSRAVGMFGSEEQKQRMLPRIADGEMIWSISLTEPGGGTDVLGAMRTTADRVDGGWVVNGAKIWSTMAHVADRLLLVARSDSDSERPSGGITVFLCDAKADGITATTIPKMGMRSIGSCEVQFDNVFIPDEDVLGEPHKGWSMLIESLNAERILVAADCCGALTGVLEDMVEYAGERTAFGKPLGQLQAVQHMIARTKIGLETARLHTYKAAWLHSTGRPAGVESTMAKVVASEECVEGADRGIQILGGYGYATEFDMQRYWRDMRLYRIAPISNEMGLNFIGETLGLPRSF
jgi:alkylation response protein AidB-like acyl-CoA dehydrogenase